jgi:hypothetical protein
METKLWPFQLWELLLSEYCSAVTVQMWWYKGTIGGNQLARTFLISSLRYPMGDVGLASFCTKTISCRN